MASGGGTKTVTYDPSVKDAELSMMKTQLTDDVTKRAYGLQKQANVYRDFALEELNNGLGLLSNYLDTQVSQSRKQLSLSEDALQSGLSLHDKAKAGANFLTAATEEYLKQAELYDRRK